MDDRVRLEPGVYGRATLVQPRFLVGLLLILAGLVWEAARGLAFFGLAPVQLGYDLDQPPVLLVLVGLWLLFRARHR